MASDPIILQEGLEFIQGSLQDMEIDPILENMKVEEEEIESNLSDSELELEECVARRVGSGTVD